MSKYTMNVYNKLYEVTAAALGISVEQASHLKPEIIIETSLSGVFDFDYPIFKEEYRKTFETNFLLNFYLREIGSETWDMFRVRLMNELIVKMPYYNELYKSTYWMAENNINPTESQNLTETYKRTSTNTSVNESTVDSNVTGDTTNTASVVSSASDNPQSFLTGDYASSGAKNSTQSVANSKNDSKAQTNANDKTDGSEDFERTIKGNAGSVLYAQIIEANRALFLNVDMMVFNECEDLFMQIY